MRNTRILICGAGIAGPTLAYWLRRYGFEPALVERAPALRAGGYMIDFWGLGFDIAEKMGLLPALRATAYEIDEIRFVDERGRPTASIGVNPMRTVLGDRYLGILRSDLARLIHGSLDGGVRTIFGDTLTSLEPDDEGVRATFAHAAPERFDLVVGAGGLHSPVRNLVFGPEADYEKYLGYYAASFSLDAYPHRDPRAYVSYAAPGRQASRYALRGDRTVLFFCFTRAARLQGEEHDVAAQKQLLRDVFRQDGWECPTMLKALDACDDLYFDSVSQIRMSAWSRGRVALVGDACFCPSLLAGQGSALAMTGAYILAGELARAGGDHRQAFGNYETRFRPFIDNKQRAAQSFAGSFAPKTKFGIFLRNQVMRLMGMPFVARLAMGGLLDDGLALPAYD